MAPTTTLAVNSVLTAALGPNPAQPIGRSCRVIDPDAAPALGPMVEMLEDAPENGLPAGSRTILPWALLELAA